MFSKMKSFVSRHKKKFIVGSALGKTSQIIVIFEILIFDYISVVVGGFAFRHLKKRIEDYQEKQIRDFLEKTRRLQHFEATEKTCNNAIFGLLPGLCENIVNSLNSESILSELRQNKSPERKLELWEELKILSFSRCCVFVYSIPILVAVSFVISLLSLIIFSIFSFISIFRL
jgi:peroxin-3